MGKLREDKLMSFRIYDSMSKNRKILNLFKFVDEIYNILKISNDPTKAISLRFFSIMTHIGAFFHFLLDNIIWLTNTGVLGRIGSPSIGCVCEKHQRLQILQVHGVHVEKCF